MCEVKRKLEQMVENNIGIGLGKEILEFKTEVWCRTVLLPVTGLAGMIIILPSIHDFLSGIPCEIKGSKTNVLKEFKFILVSQITL